MKYLSSLFLVFSLILTQERLSFAMAGGTSLERFFPQGKTVDITLDGAAINAASSSHIRLILQQGGVHAIAAASNTEIGVGEEVKISFSINTEVEKFVPPPAPLFEVVAGPYQSSSFSSINGNTTQSYSFSYVLVANREGQVTIGPGTFIANGKEYKTNPITIHVGKRRSGTATRQAPSQPAQIDDEADEHPTATLNSSNIGKHLFIRAIPDKSSAYQGEQISLTYRIYTDVDITGLQADKLPAYNGFWNLEIKSASEKATLKTEKYKGVLYHTADIKKVILFPEHSGSIALDPLELTVVVNQAVPSKNFLDNFFGSSYKEVNYKIKSNKAVIDVKPLPEEGKPPGYTGAVGRFAIHAKVDKSTLKADESLNYSLSISGSGNIKLIPPPDLNIPPDFEKYDPKTTDSVNETFDKVSGKREFTYLMIPRHEGAYKLDAFRFSYFDPKKKEYVTLKSEEFPIRVSRGLGGTNSSPTYSASSQQDVKDLTKDIRYIKLNDPDLFSEDEGFFASGTYLLLLVAAPFLFIIALLFRSSRLKQQGNIDVLRKKKAARLAARHLEMAKKELGAGRQKEFYESISKGLYGYLADKFAIPKADLNRDTISGRLSSKGLGNELISRLLDTLDICEMARFAPPSGISEHEVLEKSTALIYDIEKIL